MIRKFFLTAFSAVIIFAAAAAQGLDPNAKIPVDPDVRVGKLDNGLTYYIRHNAKPANQAEFYIYQDVGAIQEEDTQLGLAHFLEHMAFKGTKHYPGNNLIYYLETIGVKFGANLNAGTAVETTTYNMSSVPLLRDGIVDSVLLILHDWSHFITIDPAEMEKERGVIREELRQGRDASRRMREKIAPAVYNNSKYSYRNVIGEDGLLASFPHSEIVDFYHRWYRPDLQAIVIVGDFDADKMEAKVRKIMSDIPAVSNPEPKKMIPIPNNEQPLVMVATDPELTSSGVSLYIKREPVPKEFNSNVLIARLNTIYSFIGRMINYRMQEIYDKPGAPFIGARVGVNSSLAQTSDAFFGQITARDGETASAFEAFYDELEKIRRYGFTESEFDRAKTSLYRSAETGYNNRNDRRNSDFVRLYINNFRRNTPIPSANVEWELDSTFIQNTTLREVNHVAIGMLTPENQVVVVMSPEKEGIAVPTEDDIHRIINTVRVKELQPYTDNTVKEPLISKQLSGGKVAKTDSGKFGETVWTLSNGARVMIKQTDFKTDEILMLVNSEGGLSTVGNADYISGNMLANVVSSSGVGKFSSTDLSKQLTGKVVRTGINIGEYYNGLSGSASVRDFETLLQLAYLYFTEPRFDRGDYDMVIDKTRTGLSNSENDPGFIYRDSLLNTLYGHNPRRSTFTLDKLNKVSFDKMAPIYGKLYGNPDKFIYIFVGNIDPEKAKPLIEKYIGSLPSTKTKPKIADDGVRVVKGKIDNRFNTSMQVPKTTVTYTYSGDMDYNPENSLVINVLGQILRIRYFESVRKEKSGTYGVAVSPSLTRQPVPSYTLRINFDTNPEMADELMTLIDKEIESIAKDGPRADDLGKIREFLMKERPDNLRNNNTWIGYINNYYMSGIDFNSGYDELVAGLNSKQLQEMAAKILRDGNLVRVIMDPKK